jgi:hypothetical protein
MTTTGPAMTVIRARITGMLGNVIPDVCCQESGVLGGMSFLTFVVRNLGFSGAVLFLIFAVSNPGAEGFIDSHPCLHRISLLTT